MNLSERIEELRQEMILIGLSKGLSCPEVVAISEQLDELIYQKMEDLRNGQSSKHTINSGEIETKGGKRRNANSASGRN